VNRSGDFKREDLARAWLDRCAEELARTVYTLCGLHDIRRVFFAGGLSVDPTVRRAVTIEMTLWGALYSSVNKVSGHGEESGF
jgi:predicted NBD/HSP70 family sugar kinase